jgi:putative ABC transport system permease protein
MVLSVDKGFKSAVKEQLVDGIGAHLIIARGGCPMDAASIIAQGGLSPMYIPDHVINIIKDIKGIRVIMPFKTFAITLPDGSRTDIFTGLTEAVHEMRSRWKYKKGGWFKDKNSIILGADIAKIEQREIGDKIYFEQFDKEFTVCGILEYAFNQDDGIFFLPLDIAQKLVNREHKLSAIALSVHDINDLNRVKIEVKERLPEGYMTITPEAIGDDIMKFYSSIRIIMYAILFFTIFIASVGLANTMVMMIFERRREFAYLKCVGASFSNIYKLIFQEISIICSAGIISGLGAGYLLMQIFKGIIQKFLFSDYISHTARVIRPDMDIVLLTSVIIFLTGIFAITYPVFKTLKIMPMEALRNE